MARTVLPLVAALRVASVGADAGAGTCPEFEAELTDTDLNGDLLNSIWMEESATIDDCCPLCDEIAACKGFVYFGQTCYLKGGSVSTTPNEGRTSRLRHPEPTCPDFEAELADTDLNGDLLNSIWMEESATIDDCCPLCDETDGCKGFVYFGQTCYLKGGSVSTAPNEGRTSRLRHPEPTCPDFDAELTNTDLTGDDLGSIWMEAPATIDDCCSLCDGTEGCMGFVYFWQTCYLKGGNIGQVQSEGRVSRVRRSEPQCSDFEPQAVDTDLGGELLSSVWMEGNATVDDCCPICDATEGCKGFVYFEQTCHLKGGNNLGTYTNAGRITRVRSLCSGFQPAESDKDLAGDLLYSFSASASGECCDACAQNQDCQGFAFAGYAFRKWCYLKTNVTGTFANALSMASIKDGFPTRRLGSSMVLV